MRSLPVVAEGARFAFAQNLEEVAAFVGLDGTGHTRLPPAEIYRKWLVVLAAAQRHIRQLPDDRIEQDVLPDRPRSVRSLAQHVFRIVEVYVSAALGKTEYAPRDTNIPEAEERLYLTGAAVAEYGDGTIARLRAWWEGCADGAFEQSMTTSYGVQPLHEVFERSAWHSAQHVRQLAAILEREGIVPDGPLTADDLKGLPLPEGLWS
ncbi:MAG: DinB family protein [Burkholderiales bacterium]